MAECRRALYKAAATQQWKETYRQRCVERLKSSRAKLLERCRHLGENAAQEGNDHSLVQEVMEVEWHAMQSAGGPPPSLSKPDALPQGPEDAELAILEEIQQELEEQLAVAKYEQSLQFEEECLNTMLEGLDAARRVFCPVCQRNHLSVTNFYVECPCGLHIATQGMTEEKLKSLLEHSVTEHSHRCWGQPLFTATNEAEGGCSLLMCCQVCDTWMAVL